MTQEETSLQPQFLAHQSGDHVAVAVQDIPVGVARGCALDVDGDLVLEIKRPVPLGHKVALTDIAAGTAVIEYGVRIGIAMSAISAGDYVHTHNVRSARWQTSIAN